MRRAEREVKETLYERESDEQETPVFIEPEILRTESIIAILQEPVSDHVKIAALNALRGLSNILSPRFVDSSDARL